MCKIYIGKREWRTGEYMDNSALKAKGFIKSEPDELGRMGYSGACVMAENRDRNSHIKDILSEFDLENMDGIYCNSTFTDYSSVPCSGGAEAGGRALMEEFMRYPLKDVLTDMKVNIPYTGIAQQACGGIFSCIDSAFSKLKAEKGISRLLCMSEDMLPESCYYDRPMQKMLFSDTLSSVELTKEPQKIKALAVKRSAVPSDGFFLIMESLTKLIDDICSENGVDINSIEHVFFPNFWEDCWKSVLKKVGREESFRDISTKPRIAHGFSADFVSNLELYEEEVGFREGGKYLAVGYGYGGHLSCLLFDYSENRRVE